MRFQRGRSLWVPIIVIALVLFLVPLAESIDIGGMEVNPYLEIRGTYDDNINLAAGDDEVEILVADEEDDVYGNVRVGIPVTFGIGDIHSGKIAYEFSTQKFLDEDEENSERHNVKLEGDFLLSDWVELNLFYQIRKSDKRPGNVYEAPDNIYQDLGADINVDLGSDDTLLFGYQFEDKNYESLTNTSYFDFYGHKLKTAWAHKFNQDMKAKLYASFRNRTFAESNLDREGLEDGGRRIDDQYSVGLSWTQAFSEETALKAKYEYDTRNSSGDFFEYESHLLGLLVLQKLPWDIELRGYAHHKWKDYDDHATFEVDTNTAGNPVRGAAEDGNRDDKQLLVLLGVDKKITEELSAGLEYVFVDNASNDPSSEYQSNRASLSLRYEF